MTEELNTYIEQAQAGNHLAYNQIVKQWYPRIYNFAYKFFSGKDLHQTTPEMASEIAQQTFVSLYAKLVQLQDASRFRPWLYRIALNLCYEECRKHKRKRVLPFGSLTDKAVRLLENQVSHESQDYAIKGDAAHWVLKALDTLPENQRVVIIMKEYQGLTFREIAESLDLSENTVKSRMYYGLHAMKKILLGWNINKESIYG